MKRRKFVAVLCLLAVICALLFTGAAKTPTEYSGETIFANSTNAVFYVRALKEDGTLKNSGSGFTVSSGGLALTAAHVVKNAATVNVVLPSGEELSKVTVLMVDETSDIAVLRLPSGRSYSYLKLATDTPKPGERLYAIGYPLKTTKVISEGIVSNSSAVLNGCNRMVMNIELASGMSGGPIISRYGTVIGITSATIMTMNGLSASPLLSDMQEAIKEFK